MENQFIEPFSLNEQEEDIANVSCEKLHEFIKENLKKEIKNITDSILNTCNDYIVLDLEGDTRYNFFNMVETRSRNIIAGLLSGGWKEAETKKWLASYDCEVYRKKIYEANKDVIQNAYIEDLLKENKELKESVAYYRNSNMWRPLYYRRL